MNIYMASAEQEAEQITNLTEQIKTHLSKIPLSDIKDRGFFGAALDIARSLPGFSLGFISALMQAVGLMGLFGSRNYLIACEHQKRLSQVMFDFFQNETRAKKIINFYLQTESLRVKSEESGMFITMALANQKAIKLVEKFTAIKCIQELRNRVFSKNELTDKVQKTFDQSSHAVAMALEWLLTSPAAMAGFGNACLGFGYHLHGLEQLIPMVMIGYPDFAPYHTIEVVDYGSEVGNFVREFQDIRNLNDHHFPKII